MTAQQAIVVGADGSDGGRRALRFALAEAAVRGCPVRAVRVLGTDDPAAAESALEADIAAARREFSDAPEVTAEVRRGDPAEVLIDLSAAATLLVVGSHGTTSLIHSALGSVSNACAQLAQCPVVVLPRAAG